METLSFVISERRRRGGRNVGVVPLPAATQVLDQRHGALCQQSLRIPEILFGLQECELLSQEVLFAGDPRQSLGTLAGEELLVTPEDVGVSLGLLPQMIDRRKAVFDTLECRQ